MIQFGRFNAWGTVIGLYLLAAGVSGLQLLGASSWVSDVFNGVTLVLAVIFATTMRQGALAGRLRIGRRRLAEEAPAAPAGGRRPHRAERAARVGAEPAGRAATARAAHRL